MGKHMYDLGAKMWWLDDSVRASLKLQILWDVPQSAVVSIYQKRSKEGTVVNHGWVHGRAKAHRCMWVAKADSCGPIQKTLAQIAK